MSSMKINSGDTRVLLELMHQDKQLRLLLAGIIIDGIEYKVKIQKQEDCTRIHISLDKKYPGFVCINLHPGSDPNLIMKVWFCHIYESEAVLLNDHLLGASLSEGISFQNLDDTQWHRVTTLLQMEAIRRVAAR